MPIADFFKNFDTDCNNEECFRNRQFTITCCQNSVPQPFLNGVNQLQSDQSIIRHFEKELMGHSNNCAIYSGLVSYNQSAVEYDVIVNRRSDIEIQCDCGNMTNVDRNCRPYLDDCRNGGKRLFAIGLRCACDAPFFGDLCEYQCHNGDRIKGFDNRDYCKCHSPYTGVECRQHQCQNGGISVDGKCQCFGQFTGPYCTMMLSSDENGNDNSYKTAIQRDFTGTIISLILVVTLLSAMYCMLRRRLNMAARRHHMISRLIHNQMIETTHQSGRHARLTARAVDGDIVIPGDNSQSREQQIAIYAAYGMRPPRYYDENEYPPLPSYFDLVKSDENGNESASTLELETMNSTQSITTELRNNEIEEIRPSYNSNESDEKQ